MKRAAMLGMLLPLLAAAAPPSPPAPIDLLRSMVEADTTHGTASLAARLRRMVLQQGFAPADAQVLAPEGQPGEANLVVRLRGKDLAPPVLFIGHLDVVTTAGQSWTVPPFALTEKGGFLYGRGTLDMKGEDVAMLLGLIGLKRDGFVPDRDIVLALTADEETGKADGVRWLLQTHRRDIDAAFVVNPDEGAAAMRLGRRVFYGIQTSTKRYVTYRLTAHAPGGHTAAPAGRNAVYVLAAGLQRLSGYRFPVRLDATTRAYFTALASRATGERKHDLLGLLAIPPDPGAVGRIEADPAQAPNLQSTCTPTMLHASDQENVLAETAEATIQCRLLPGDDPEAVRRTLLDRIADPTLSLAVAEPGLPAPALPLDPGVIARVRETAQSIWPGLLVTPALNTGSSDSDFTRAAGLPTYGLCSIFYDQDDDRMHAADERITASAFADGLLYMKRLMRALGSR